MVPGNALKTPVKRWRFQFSLRALMILVFAYCGLWLLTFKLGPPALARQYAALYTHETIHLTGNDRIPLEVEPVFDPYNKRYRVPPSAIRGTVSVPMPFVVVWSWERNVRGVWMLMPEFKSTHYWIPGRNETNLTAPRINYSQKYDRALEFLLGSSFFEQQSKKNLGLAFQAWRVLNTMNVIWINRVVMDNVS